MENVIKNRHRSWTFSATTLSSIFFYYRRCCSSTSFVLLLLQLMLFNRNKRGPSQVHYTVPSYSYTSALTQQKCLLFIVESFVALKINYAQKRKVFLSHNLITSTTLTKKNEMEQISLWGQQHWHMTVRAGRSHHLWEIQGMWLENRFPYYNILLSTFPPNN